jgi:hypothetical protein
LLHFHFCWQIHRYLNFVAIIPLSINRVILDI